MEVALFKTENKIYSDVRRLANRNTPYNDAIIELRYYYPESQIQKVLDELKDEVSTENKTFSKISFKPISVYSAPLISQNAINKVRSNNQINIENIVDYVCNYMEVPIEKVLGKARHRSLVEARHLCMYLARVKTGKALSEIGRHFNRDHSTVIHAITKIDGWLSIDKKFLQEYNALISQIDNRL